MKKENQVLGLITNKNKALERERQLKHREQIIMNRTNHKERKNFRENLLCGEKSPHSLDFSFCLNRVLGVSPKLFR